MRKLLFILLIGVASANNPLRLHSRDANSMTAYIDRDHVLDFTSLDVDLFDKKHRRLGTLSLSVQAHLLGKKVSPQNVHFFSVSIRDFDRKEGGEYVGDVHFPDSTHLTEADQAVVRRSIKKLSGKLEKGQKITFEVVYKKHAEYHDWDIDLQGSAMIKELRERK